MIDTTRRRFLASTLADRAGDRPAIAPCASSGSGADKASIAITLDLEMSRHYPKWDEMHWDYEKGNLDAATKGYAVEAARRVKSRGGVIHFFAVGQTMEQEDVGWLKEIVAEGHPVGNHTYDHVNVKATRAEDIQFRFRRAPWLIEGKTPAEVIAANIRMGEPALEQRIGIAPAGFRTPGGFNDGLTDRPDLQSMLQKMGYTWVSSKYPAHPLGTVGQAPDAKVICGDPRGPGAGPAVCLSVGADRGADEPGQRRHRITQRSLAAGGVSGGDPGGSDMGHRAAGRLLLSGPPVMPGGDRPGFQDDRDDLRAGAQAGDRAALVDLNTIARETKERETLKSTRSNPTAAAARESASGLWHRPPS